MSTEQMGVRKFVRTFDGFLSRSVLEEAGYHLVEFPKHSYNEMISDHVRLNEATSSNRRVNPIIIETDVTKWCDNQFGKKHWILLWNFWIFTKQDDAVFFKLTWSK